MFDLKIIDLLAVYSKYKTSVLIESINNRERYLQWNRNVINLDLISPASISAPEKSTDEVDAN